MQNVTYNLIVKVGNASFNYWRRIRELAQSYGVQDSLIVCNTNRVTIVYFKDGSLEKKIFKGKPYSTIPAAVTAHEQGIPRTDTPRWVIAPPSVIDKVKEGLRNSGFFNGKEYLYVEIGAVYENNSGPINNGPAAVTEEKSPRANDVAGTATNDRLAKLLETARIRGVRTDPMPNLAELIQKVSR